MSKTILAVLLLAIPFLLYYNYASAPRQNDAEMPTGLHPSVEFGRNQLLQKTAKIGITISITEDFRSMDEQDELYAQGRTDSGSIVTHARGGESFHNYGLAIDFALVTQNGNLIWDMEYDGNGNAKSDWIEVVKIAKQLGFEWGGDWEEFKDYPHLEMSFGLTFRELQNGERPPQ